MENMALILMLAVTAEGLVEYGKSVGKAIVERQAKTAESGYVRHLQGAVCHLWNLV